MPSLKPVGSHATDPFKHPLKTVKRSITPHKGGRSICKSTNVTPETDTKLRYLKELDGSSLGDVIEWAVGQLIPQGEK